MCQASWGDLLQLNNLPLDRSCSMTCEEGGTQKRSLCPWWSAQGILLLLLGPRINASVPLTHCHVQIQTVQHKLHVDSVPAMLCLKLIRLDWHCSGA